MAGDDDPYASLPDEDPYARLPSAAKPPTLGELSSPTQRRFGRVEQGVDVVSHAPYVAPPLPAVTGPDEVQRKIRGYGLTPQEVIDRASGDIAQGAVGAAKMFPWMISHIPTVKGAEVIGSAAGEAAFPTPARPYHERLAEAKAAGVQTPTMAEDRGSFMQRVMATEARGPLSQAMDAVTKGIGDVGESIFGPPKSQEEVTAQTIGGLAPLAPAAVGGVRTLMRGLGVRPFPISAEDAGGRPPTEPPGGIDRRGSERLSDEDYLKITGETREQQAARLAADETTRMPVRSPAVIARENAERYGDALPPTVAEPEADPYANLAEVERRSREAAPVFFAEKPPEAEGVFGLPEPRAGQWLTRPTAPPEAPAALPAPEPAPEATSDRIVRGEGLPAVRDDTGHIWTRKQPAEHGDLFHHAEGEGAEFSDRNGQSGWIIDRKFYSTREFSAEQRALGGSRVKNVRITEPGPEAVGPGAPAPTPEPAPQVTLGGAPGRTDRVKLSDQTSHPVEWRWAPLDDVHASINPETFQPTAPERFRPGIQQRTYDRATQETLASRAPEERLDPDRVLEPTRAIESGPPTVTDRGEAVAGTERLVRIKRAAAHDPEAYAAYVARAKEDAAAFGIDPAEMERPGVLVRVLQDPALNNDVEALARLNERSDKTLTKLKGRFEEGVGRAGRLRAAETAMPHFTETIGPDQSVRDYLGTAPGREFVLKLATEGVIDPAEKAAYLKPEGPTEEGKSLIEGMLRASAFGDAATLRRTPPSVLNKFDAVLGPVAKTNGLPGYELQPHLQKAVNLLADARDQGAASVRDFAAQGDLERPPPDPNDVKLAAFLDEAPRSQLHSAMRKYATLADEAVKQGESGQLFGETPQTSQEILDRALREAKPEGKKPEGGFVIPVALLRATGGVVGGAVGAHFTEEDDTWWAKALKVGTGALIGLDAGHIARGAFNKSLELRDGLYRLANPGGRGPEAKFTVEAMTERLGQIRGEIARAEETVKGFRDQMGKHYAISGDTPQARLGSAGAKFVDNIERGQPQGNAILDQTAKTLRKIMDQTAQVAEQVSGRTIRFYQDYFPHIWKDPAKAAQFVQDWYSRRPLEGSRAFLKQRTFPTIADGLAAGLEPVSENPVDLVLLKKREMEKFIMASRTADDLTTKGLLRDIPPSGKVAPGYVRVNDRSQVFRDKMAPEPVARVINNHLSSGLRGNAIFDSYMAVGNALNQAQLGLSAFHLGFTSMEAVISTVANSIRQGARGDVLQAGKTLAGAPIAPFTQGLKGYKLERAYLAPGSQGPVMDAMVKHLETAGGAVKMDEFWTNRASKAFKEAWEARQAGKAVVTGIGAALEKASAPVFKFAMYQKLGAAYDLMAEELARLPSGASHEEVRAALQRGWRSADNRFGQVVYDNKFWNRAFKDVAMGSVRSVGWNYGTFAELGGGAADLARGRLSSRAAYVIALPVTAGLTGGLVTYLATGKPPEELKDYYWPKTGHVNPDGSDERMQLPTYMKDVAGFASHPVQTIEHKASPAVGLVKNLLTLWSGTDFYGDRYRNQDDPVVQQIGQVINAAIHDYAPFAVQGMLEEGKRGQSVVQKALPFVGVTPAPRSATRTPAENRMMDLLGRRREVGATPEEAERRGSIATALRQLREGDAEGFRRTLGGSNLGTGDVARILKRAQQDPWVERFKSLQVEDAMDVFDKMSDEEKARYAPAMMAKLQRAAAAGQRTSQYQGLLQPER